MLGAGEVAEAVRRRESHTGGRDRRREQEPDAQSRGHQTTGATQGVVMRAIHRLCGTREGINCIRQSGLLKKNTNSSKNALFPYEPLPSPHPHKKQSKIVK